MGAWGAGVFDNDEAMDVLTDASAVATTEIQGFYDNRDRCGFEDIDCVLACIAIQTSLITGCGAEPPTRTYAETIRDRMLEIYDNEVDDHDPEPEYKIERRKCLHDTLDLYVATATD